MNKKVSVFLILSAVLLTAGMLLAVCLGAKRLPFDTVASALLKGGDSLEIKLVRDVRLPRTAAAALTGGMLALAGAVMQGVTRNPLAEPSIMGMTQGASLAVAAASVLPAVSGLFSITAAALLGAFLGGILVLGFCLRTSKLTISRLLLAGTALGTFFLSLSSLIGILGNRSQELAFWAAGGFKSVTWAHVAMLVPMGVFALILSCFLAGRMNVLSLGDEAAVGLGVSPAKVRLISILLLIPICAVCAASAGNIAFVGLIIPHMVRKMFCHDYRSLLPLSFLGGSVLMVWADLAARLANQPYETPVGLFTSIIGVPVFLWMIRKETSR
ncbi:FecCD family ABC transporter permease [Anaerostipes sp.]|uniref:FecCD family ABC transporter permease n=1 Tax=Anaerostipes sp. TaxID=1872530 RepID=UPI0025C6565D|nr:iron ABC transporter permease [Anaerostipes sp.]MBS7008817.1 iron ABC transporter permease [Anaerostipes sp.]